MPSAESLITFTLAALLMNLSPGPSNLYVMARTLAQGAAGGLAAVMGLAAGSLVHVLATVLGLSALFSYSPAAYAWVKTIGALYLIYLGVRYLKTFTKDNLDTKRETVHSLKKVFFESALVEITNPKTALFFLALLPQFVAVDTGPVAPQLLLLGIIVTLSAIPCDLLVAFFAGRFAAWIRANQQAQRIQKLASGSVLIGLGVYVLASED